MRDLLERDAGFASRWRDAMDDANDDIELAARRWACNGVLPGETANDTKRPEVIRRYSEQLLILLLKTNLPDKYDPGRAARARAAGGDRVGAEEIGTDPDPPRAPRGRDDSGSERGGDGTS